MLWIKSLPTRCCAFISVLAMFFACTPEENNASGTDEPGGGKDKTVHVTGISLNPTVITIKEGESATITATVTPDNADNKAYSWSSSNVQVASVSDGKVVGIKAGSTTIIVSTEDGGKTATCSVTVEQNLAPSVTVGADHISAISALLQGKANLGNSASSDLKVGFQYSKSAGILPSNSTTIEVTDADASYNYTAAITGLDPETKYYFRSFVRQNGQDTYGETKEFTTQELSSLLHTQEASSISAVSAELNAKLDLTDVKFRAKSSGFYWGISSESVSTKVTAQEGEGSISADLSQLVPSKEYFFQAYVILDGKELKEEVLSFTTKEIESVLGTLDATNIEATSASLNAKLDLTDVKYSSNSYGFYWGTSEGSQNTFINGEAKDNAMTASMTALNHKTQYWYKAYVKLDNQTFYGEVKSFTTDVVKVESVYLDKTEYTFNTIGNTLTLKATVLPADATDKSVEWSSDKEDVAAVDANGRVTAKGNGKATITVTAKDGNGAQVTCEVEVKQYVTSISLNKTSLSLEIGDEVTLSVTILPDNANDKTYTWSSSDSAIASVDNSGKVTAKAKGKATIKATANDGSGVNATCSVVVSLKCPAGAVDMGTTTADGYKLYWGTSNLGAGKPEEYGDYYAWGEIAPYYSSQGPLTWKDGKTGYNWASYKWCNGSSSTLTKYNTRSSYGTVDNKKVLEPEDDVASVKLGGKWRMPKNAEWAELTTKCKWSWTTLNGVNGRLVTATNGNSIFLPAAGGRSDTSLNGVGSYGLYWSSSLHADSPLGAWYVYFYSDDVFRRGYYRYFGRSVRPVSE